MPALILTLWWLAAAAAFTVCVALGFWAGPIAQLVFSPVLALLFIAALKRTLER